MNEEITRKVIAVIAQWLELDPEQIQLESSLAEDLHADSLAVAEIFLELEAAFNIDPPEDDKVIESIKTVQDAIKYVEDHKG